MKLHPIGISGILIKAKQEKLIDNVKPHIDKLIQEAHFFIHPKLYDEVLRLANE